MSIDWDFVKAKTLWNYEELTGKILDVLGYGFVQEHYNHSLQEAADYARLINQGYFQGRNEDAYIAGIIENFDLLGDLGVKNYLGLVQQVETKEKCESFLKEAGISFEPLIETLNYLFRMALPFKNPLREYVYSTSRAELSVYEILKRLKFKTNLDVLDRCGEKGKRLKVEKESEISEAVMLTLLHRTDISRLAYVRGKTVLHLCGGGYDTLDKIACADLKTMEADMTIYCRTIGKEFSDFKAVIPLNWMIGGARILPRVVEE